MCMCICIYIYVYVYVYVSVCACVCTYVCIRVIYIYVYVCIRVWMYIPSSTGRFLRVQVLLEFVQAELRKGPRVLGLLAPDPGR